MLNGIKIFVIVVLIGLLIGTYQIWNEGLETSSVIAMSFLWIVVGYVSFKILPAKKNKDPEN
jgi:hypothetical protein